ncbi:MAG: glycosyltransferase [Akkermansiaceae bacterium]
MRDLVSVIFPVGPGARGALDALEDLKGQTWRELEIIAVLNGCPDAVRAAFQKERDPRVHLLDLGAEPHLIRALNAAVESASGKWLARMDTDDRCHSERIERTLAPLIAGKWDVVSCGIELVHALGEGMQRYVDWVNQLTDPERLARERFVESPVVQPTVMMSRETLVGAGGYWDDGFAEDYSLWLRLLAQGKCFGKVKDQLYSWRDHEERLTRMDGRFSHKKMLVLKAQAISGMEAVSDRGVAICGSGPIAKILARELLAREVKVHGFFDIDPKRIGSTCQGKPIVSHDEFGSRWREAVQLAAVGTPGGREAIRQAAQRLGFQEGDDFWCCC